MSCTCRESLHFIQLLAVFAVYSLALAK